ncbi:unnamed protein product [Sympodiomycopsis kandeliae]
MHRYLKMTPRRAAAVAASKKSKYFEGSDSDDDGGGSSGSDFQQEDNQNESDAAAEDDIGTDDEDVSEEDVSRTKKRASAGNGVTPVKKRKTQSTPSKAQPKAKKQSDSDSETGEITSVNTFTPAPKERHQKGMVGKPVIEFMTKLLDPKYNDREWFQLNERVWKWVKQDFEEFVTDFLESLMEDVDETVPYLPTKDMVYRIHRDVRFSNDKTPYKRTLMATFSRGGRKGPFAGYHLCIRAGGQSALHAGLWDPPSDYLATLREHIQNDTPQIQRLKEIIHRKEFINHFGPPKPDPKKGIIGSLWGQDPLKTAPRGIDKSHPDIDLFRLKSYCITERFTDEQVIQDDWKEKLIQTALAAKDFVECVNDMIHPS